MTIRGYLWWLSALQVLVLQDAGAQDLATVLHINNIFYLLASTQAY